MVINIPAATDFEEVSIGALNLAWDIAYELLSQKDEAEMEMWDDDGSVSDKYWHAAQRPLGNAVTLVQQAHELGLKGKIVEFSPFILVAQDVRNWPSASATGVDFSKFRSLDAIDLPKVYDLFSETPLDTGFKTLYEEVRKSRNVISHGVSKADRIVALEVLKWIFQSFKSLYSAKRWSDERLRYMYESPVFLAYPNDQTYVMHLLELEAVLGTLTTSEQSDWLGTNKKARWYICPGRCFDEMHHNDALVDRPLVALAQFADHKSRSKKLYCFVCNTTHIVQRRPCSEIDCKSDVTMTIESSGLTCLKCGKDQQ